MLTMAEGGGDRKPSEERSKLSESSAPRVPEFDSNNPSHMQALGIATQLLRDGLTRMDAPPELLEAIGVAEQEFAGPSAPPQPVAASAPNGELLRVADEFHRSPFAEEVAQMAREVSLSDVNFQWFKQALRNLFSRGYSVEAFVTLFYFVCCLLIRFYGELGWSASSQLLTDMTRWFLAYVLGELLQFIVDFIKSLTHVEQRYLAIGFGAGVATTVAVFLVAAFLHLRRG